MNTHVPILIVGGGTAGITVAARLSREPDVPEMALIEPSAKHYYQPIWTLVGAGLFEPEVSERDTADYVPTGVTWIQDRVARLEPDASALLTEAGRRYTYDYLVVAPGIQIDWHRVEGLPETLGRNGVASNYSYDHVAYTWEAIQALGPGSRAVFTQPSTPIKCGGAPQKILYLTADHCRREGMLDRVDIDFFSPGQVVFGVPEFARTLEGVLERYGIDFHFRHDLVAVRGAAREAVFRAIDEEGEVSEKVVPFDLLHVAPPMSAPAFVAESPLAAENGFAEVDPHTLQHVRYANVFALGDVAATPNAKTGAAVRKQAPVVVRNVMEVLRTGRLADPARYDGYSSCPLVTAYDKMVLAEFDYSGRPAPSFPFDTTKERYSMFALKAYGLPRLYWHGMLRGRF